MDRSQKPLYRDHPDKVFPVPALVPDNRDQSAPVPVLVPVRAAVPVMVPVRVLAPVRAVAVVPAVMDLKHSPSPKEPHSRQNAPACNSFVRNSKASTAGYMTVPALVPVTIHPHHLYPAHPEI